MKQEGIILNNDQQKDAILEGFCTFGTGVAITPKELVTHKPILRGLYDRDLVDLIEFLVLKGFVNPVVDKQLFPQGERAYSLTVAGRLFVKEDGGFEKLNQTKLRIELLEKNQMDLQINQTSLMAEQTTIQSQMTAWTKVLAFAAIAAFFVAVVALFWDIWKFYHSCH